MKRNILLLEPNYKNKYPPIGLMKIATYHRRMGDNVVFFKGDLKYFLVEHITSKCIDKLNQIDPNFNWNEKRGLIFSYIKTRKKEFLNDIYAGEDENIHLILTWLEFYKNYYHKKEYLQEPYWDRIFVTTLFTFYWDITIDTINFAKGLIKDTKDLMVGGVMATILTDEIEVATGIRPHKGLLNTPGQLDNGNQDIIDDLPLDYSILDEIEYEYPDNNAYYGYTTRGCIRHCKFCAVPTLEPNYCEYIPLADKVNTTATEFGDKRNLLLMDNNILASKQLPRIIEEIKSAGFYKGATFVEPNWLYIAISNLKKGINDRAYIRRAYYEIEKLNLGIKNEELKLQVYKSRKQLGLLKLDMTTKENLLLAYDQFADIYERYRNKSKKLRYIDFNQGVDARLFTPEIVRLLGEIPIKPLRIAFDNLSVTNQYTQAIKWSANEGIKDFSNYLLYNFNDKPVELYERLKINVELCEELDINIYSFPMKYHPLSGQYSQNRDFIGQHWNRKYIRAVQAVLNSTKGKIGRGVSFFYEAFGKTPEEFTELLEMPETMILYRFFFKWTGHTERWHNDFKALNAQDKTDALKIIHDADFSHIGDKGHNTIVVNFLKHYTNYRKEIITPGTELYELKKQYDANPTISLKRKH